MRAPYFKSKKGKWRLCDNLSIKIANAQPDYLSWCRARPAWQHIVTDSLLAIIGIVAVTVLIMAAHLYTRLPSIVLIYLIVIIALATVRGSYAATLATLLSSYSFAALLPPPDQFVLVKLDDLLDPDPVFFLATAIFSSQLTAALRRHARQAKQRERETRLLSIQAQELAILRERQRLARELHDSVSQALYGISLGAHTAREALESNPEDAAVPLEYIVTLADAGLAEMRTLIFELRPESLATEGIVATLNKQIAILHTRYKLAFNAQLCEEPPLSLDGKETLYRIAHEALHNIVKHASAHTVSLSLRQQDGWLTLEVGDDGKGFAPNQKFPGHLGLRSIEERTQQLGGSCTIESAPAQGTHLQICIPCA